MRGRPQRAFLAETVRPFAVATWGEPVFDEAAIREDFGRADFPSAALSPGALTAPFAFADLLAAILPASPARGLAAGLPSRSANSASASSSESLSAAIDFGIVAFALPQLT